MRVEIIDGELVCPLCGGRYLHQVKTSIFQRGEDETTCTRTVVEGRNTQVTAYAHNSENPSGRRQGMVIRFECEQAGDHVNPNTPLELLVSQHKGNTLMVWRDYDTNTPPWAPPQVAT